MKKVTIQFCFILFLYIVVGCTDRADSTKQVRKSELKNSAGSKEKWHWNNKQKQNESVGYAQVVKVGNTLYVSGIPTGDLSPKGITEVYRSLEKSLRAFGATSKDIVKETLYTTDIETMKKYNGTRKEFYAGDFPAATWVQVSRLYEPDARLEVDLIAELPVKE